MDSDEARFLLASIWDGDAEVWQTRWAPVFRAFAEEVVRRAAPQPGERLLDIGTGTGTVIELALPSLGPEGRAVGIDRSAEMVARAKRALAAAGNARVLEMDAAQLDFPDGWFDAAVSNCGVPFLGHALAYREARRVLKPGGRAVFSDWHLDQVAAARILADVFAKHKTQNPGARLRRLRDAQALWVKQADALDAREKVEAALRTAAFRDVRGETITHTLHAFTLESFIEARLARTLDRLELDEMLPAARDSFFREAREALAHLVHDGQFEVLWPVFYVSGVK